MLVFIRIKQLTIKQLENMNNYELFRELAGNNDLKFIETTNAANGYPLNLQPALIGFETFEEAENFAQEHDLDVMMFHRRDGWRLWERQGMVHEPMTITQEDYGDNYDVVDKKRASEYYENEVRPVLGDFKSFEDLEVFVEKQREIIEELDSMDDDEAVVTYCGEYYETIKTICMEWGFDTHNYVIGVIKL